MQISIEQINLNADRSFRAYAYDFLSQGQSFHSHDEFELATVSGTGGVVYCAAETAAFAPDDLFLFGGRLPHRFIPRSLSPPSLARVVQFRHDAFGEGFFKLPENTLIRNLLDRASGGLAIRSQVIDVPGRLADVIDSPSSRRLPGLLLLLTELAEIVDRGDSESLSPGEPVFKNRAVDAERLSRLQDFIESDYAGPASVDSAAETLALTRTSFCRYVKRMTGRTFTELVNDYRLTMAAMMLRDSAPAVSVVSMEAGFGSLSHFNSRFKARFGKTPTEYRSAALSGKDWKV